MERGEFLKLIYKIYNVCDVYKSKRDRHVPWKNLTPQQAKFIGSLLKDRERILNLFSHDNLGKKGGISGKNLIITVKILNRDDENPALEKYVGFDHRWIVVYFGISPELENFVSIVMWPSGSKSSKECYRTILSLFKEENKSLKFTGSYHIILPNEIHPQRVEKLEIEKDKQVFYDWQFFPFIKDVGETLSRPISAPNYRRVLLRNERGELIEDYITIRTTVGSVVDIKGNEIKVKVPFLRSKPHIFIFRLRHNINDRIERDSIYYFLLIERAGEKIPEVFEIEPAEIGDALAHCLAFELYRRFIKNISSAKHEQYTKEEINNLFHICNIEEWENLFKKYASFLCKIYRKEMPRNINLLWDFIKVNLLPYFKINTKKGGIYYFPILLRRHPQNLLYEKLIKFMEVNKIIRHYTLIGHYK